MNVIVFDIGKTLMEYENMPNVWVDYYYNAFNYICKIFQLDISEKDIYKSVQILTEFNPSINYRENEYSSEFIFQQSIQHWNVKIDIKDIIGAFFESMNLKPTIYPEAMDIMKMLKQNGFKIAAFTDIVTGMPDQTHRNYISKLIPYFDYYVSSLSCGYRKPNPKGLECISKHFNVRKSDLIFIGDEKKDIQAAIRFGCKSILIDRNNTQQNYGQNYTITNLIELIDIVANLT